MAPSAVANWSGPKTVAQTARTGGYQSALSSSATEQTYGHTWSARHVNLPAPVPVAAIATGRGGAAVKVQL